MSFEIYLFGFVCGIVVGFMQGALFIIKYNDYVDKKKAGEQ